MGSQRQNGYVREEELGWLPPENRDAFLRALQGFRKMIADTLLVQFNQGAMPHEMFMNHIRRFSTEVMPELRRHTVTNTVAVEA